MSKQLLKKYKSNTVCPFAIDKIEHFPRDLEQKLWNEYQLSLEQDWEHWIKENEHFIKNIGIPNVAFLSRNHFVDFIYNYFDKYSGNGEYFDVNKLEKIDALKLLVLLDSFVEEPLNCEVYCDLRIYCGYEFEFGNMPPLPQCLICQFIE
jgi:hypothetical protein